MCNCICVSGWSTCPCDQQKKENPISVLALFAVGPSRRHRDYICFHRRRSRRRRVLVYPRTLYTLVRACSRSPSHIVVNRACDIPQSTTDPPSLPTPPVASSME